jgi:Domain of unknown function (DUF4190)
MNRKTPNRVAFLADASVARSGETVRQDEWRSELLRAGIRGKGGRQQRTRILSSTRPGSSKLEEQKHNTMNEAPPISNIPAEPKKCSLAVWSLVLGILAIVLVCIGPLFAIPAVICGHMAHSRIKRSAGALTGGGLALGGLITGYLSIALIPIIGMMAAIAIPNFVKARTTAQKNMCINNLRQIDGAKQQWALENKKQTTDTPTAQDLETYLRRSFTTLKCPVGGIYTINAAGEKPTCSIPQHDLSATTTGNSL